jgi:hypothetical protein
MPREREGDRHRWVEVGTADVTHGVDAEHDHEPEGDRNSDVPELAGLRVHHHRAAAGEYEGEGADQFRDQEAREGRLH